MKIDGRKFSTEEKHLIRRMAAQRYLEGESPTRIAASYGVSAVSVHRWGKQAGEAGIDSLSPKPKPGRPKKLTREEEDEVFRWVAGGDPRQLGLYFGLWTRKIIADQIEQRLGIAISVTSVESCFIALAFPHKSRFVAPMSATKSRLRNGSTSVTRR